MTTLPPTNVATSIQPAATTIYAPTGPPGGTLGGAAASQFVVVAIVACGVFAAMVVTFWYKRRRNINPALDEWAWGGGTRLLHTHHGVVEVRRKRRRKLGPEPKVWDAVIDREEEESDDEDDEEYGEKEKSWKWKGKQRDEVASWSPLAVSMPSNPDPFRPSADVTVLIAMPEPMRERDDYDFPLVELGTYTQPVDDAAALWALRPPKPPKRTEEVEEAEVQRVRVDGFRRFRRAYA